MEVEVGGRDREAAASALFLEVRASGLAQGLGLLAQGAAGEIEQGIVEGQAAIGKAVLHHAVALGADRQVEVADAGHVADEADVAAHLAAGGQAHQIEPGQEAALAEGHCGLGLIQQHGRLAQLQRPRKALIQGLGQAQPQGRLGCRYRPLGCRLQGASQARCQHNGADRQGPAAEAGQICGYGEGHTGSKRAWSLGQKRNSRGLTAREFPRPTRRARGAIVNRPPLAPGFWRRWCWSRASAWPGPQAPTCR